MNKALIVVDVQIDFCEGGSLGVAGGSAVAESIAALLAGQHGYARVVATRDHHIAPGSHFSANPDYVDSWPPHCVVGTQGQLLHPALRDFPFDAIFDKGSYAAAYSGFEGSIGATPEGEKLAQWLGEQGITAVDVCGLATDFCVQATARDAALEGFETAVLSNLTAAVHPDNVASVKGELLDERIAWA